MAHRDSMLDRYFWMTAGARKVFSMAVTGGGTLECVFGQFWSSLGDGSVEVEVSWQGLLPSCDAVALVAGSGAKRVEVSALVRPTQLKPSASLTHHLSTHRPERAQLRAGLVGRDVLPRGRHTHTLLLEYEVENAEACEATLHPAPLSQLLYESPFESQLAVVLDASKRVLGWSDAWPARQYPLALPKGALTVRLQVRHSDRAALEKLGALPLTVRRKLKKKVGVEAYASLSAAATRTTQFGSKPLRRGQRAPVFLLLPDLDATQLPPGYGKAGGKGKAAVAHSLAGTVTWASRSGDLPGASSRPGGFPIEAALPPAKKKDFKVAAGSKRAQSAAAGDKAEGGGSEGKEPRAASDGDEGGDKAKGGSGEEEKKAEEGEASPLEAAVRDAKIAFLAKLTGTDAKSQGEAQALIAELMAFSPKHLPLHEAILSRAASRAEKVEPPQKMASSSPPDGVVVARPSAPGPAATLGYAQSRAEVAAAAKALADVVDTQELAAHFGRQQKKNDSEAEAKNKKMKKRKAALIDALTKQATALAEVALLSDPPVGSGESKGESKEESGGARLDAFRAACERLEQWIDIDKSAVPLATLRHRLHGRYGCALAAVRAQLKKLDDEGAGNAKGKKLLQECEDICERLGWTDWQMYHKTWLLLRFPDDYPTMS
jgi:hypothetical protein